MIIVKQLLWWLFTGTRGGLNRAKIVKLLYDRPYNANQLAEVLKLDYKTIKHHIGVLLKNDIIIESSEGQHYGKLFFMTPFMENNEELFLSIWEKLW